MTCGRRRRATGAALALVVVSIFGVASTGGNPAEARTTKRFLPIRVMTMGDFETQDADNAVWALAVRARFASGNLRGGIVDANGQQHRVLVSACNTAFDPTRAAACARRAVQMHVTAVLGLTSVDSAEIWPILEAAGIPVIGARVNTAADASSPVSFPLGAGLPGVFRAMPYLLARVGADHVGVVISDYGDATDALLGAIEQGISGAGSTAGPVAFVTPDDNSLADAATAMMRGGADGVIGFVAEPGRGDLLRELGRAGFTGPYVTQAPVGVSALASDADVSQAALLVGQFAPVTADVPGMRQFRTDMDESSGGATLQRTEGAVNNWLAAWVLEQVVRRLERVDAPSVLREMGQLDRLDTGGVTPPLSTVQPGRLLARLFNATVAFSSVSAGNPPRQLDAGFVDVVDGHVVS
jgi:branched-chain amino acid transport system substrate-binding protein